MAGFVSGILILFVGVYLLMPTDNADEFGMMNDEEFAASSYRGSEAMIDIDVSIDEDFNNKRKMSGGEPELAADAEIPRGLPPLGEGIPAAELVKEEQRDANRRSRGANGERAGGVR